MTSSGLRCCIAIWVMAVVVIHSPAAAAQAVSESTTALTLREALAEARRANAKLPVARQQVRGAAARARRAKGALYPSLSVNGDLHAGVPQRYASSDGLLQLSLETPIYDGGQLRAGVAGSRADLAATRAGYQMAVRDLEYRVRLAFGRVLRAQGTLSFRQRGIRRLEANLTVVQAREAAGQGLAMDALQIRQRIASARAGMATARRELHDSRMALNQLMGRTPNDALVLAPMPDPGAPARVSGEPWLDTPDVEQSSQAVRASRANLKATRAGRRLHVSLEANLGTQPSFGSGISPLNNGTGSGGELLLNFRLPLWDKGVYAGRVADATAAVQEALDRRTVVQRAARLAWSQAVSDLDDLYREYRARSTAARVARDAWLQSESLYRGGQGSALAVVDAYDAWTRAAQARIDVIYSYRIASAQLKRWGTP